MSSLADMDLAGCRQEVAARIREAQTIADLNDRIATLEQLADELRRAGNRNNWIVTGLRTRIMHVISACEAQ